MVVVLLQKNYLIDTESIVDVVSSEKSGTGRFVYTLATAKALLHVSEHFLFLEYETLHLIS